MPSRKDPVAILNEVTGKTTPRKSPAKRKRMAVDPEDISFSSKKQRLAPKTKGTLQQRRKSSPQLKRPRRSSYTVPSEGEPDSAMAPANKKAKRLLVVKRKAADKSPLKGLGFDVEIPTPDTQIDFHDSPVPNTRARKPPNPLSKLQNLIAPEPQPVREEPQRRKTRHSEGGVGLLVPPLYPYGKEAELLEEEAEVEDGESGGDEDSGEQPVHSLNERPRNVGGQSDEEREVNEGGARQDANNAGAGVPEIPVVSGAAKNARTSTNRASAGAKIKKSRIADKDAKGKEAQASKGSDQHTSQKQTEQHSSRRDHGDSTVGKPADPTKHSSQSQRKKKDKDQAAKDMENRKLHEAAEAKKQQKRIDIFLRKLGSGARLGGCHDFWAGVGNGVLWLREEYGDVDASTKWARAIQRTIDDLNRAYIALRRGTDPTEDGCEQKISDLLNKLENRCTMLSPGADEEQGAEFALDLCRCIIPSTALLFGPFFKARYKDETTFASSPRDELLRLLQITIKMCKAVRDWEPRPQSLEKRTLLVLRKDVLAKLSKIQMPFQMEADREIRAKKLLEKEQQDNEWLEERQRRWLEAREQERFDRLYRRSAVTVTRSSVIERQKRDAYDIDEVTSETSTSSEGSGEDAMHVRKPLRPRGKRNYARQITARPPDEWTNEELTALLNGLQLFTSGNRYEDILNEYDVLSRRDIDDLIAKARSFRQAMLSFSTKEQMRQRPWLLSVE